MSRKRQFTKALPGRSGPASSTHEKAPSVPPNATKEETTNGADLSPESVTDDARWLETDASLLPIELTEEDNAAAWNQDAAEQDADEAYEKFEEGAKQDLKEMLEAPDNELLNDFDNIEEDGLTDEQRQIINKTQLKEELDRKLMESQPRVYSSTVSGRPFPDDPIPVAVVHRQLGVSFDWCWVLYKFARVIDVWNNKWCSISQINKLLDLGPMVKRVSNDGSYNLPAAKEPNAVH